MSGSDVWDAYADANALWHSEHMERIAAVLAQNFKMLQYDEREDVPYRSDWDLFFWCNDFSQTTRGRLSGRDCRYFTLCPSTISTTTSGGRKRITAPCTS